MSFDLGAILRLGDLDRDLIRARRRRESAQRLAAPQLARVRLGQAELERSQEETKAASKEVTRLEGDAKAKAADAERLQVALNQAKSNEEYQGLLRSVQTRQAELSEIETKILEAYEAQEERAKTQAEGRARLTRLEKDLAEAQTRVRAEEEAASKDEARLAAERAEVAGGISPEHLGLYERVLARTGDTATAEVVNEICQGCYMKVRPEQVSQIRGRKELVTCWTCDRILHGRFGE